MTLPNTPSRPERSIPWLFGMTSLFADMTYELAHVLLPGLLLALGGTAVSAAMMESLADLARIGGFFIAGRSGTSPESQSRLVRVGYATTIVATVLFSLAAASWEIVFLKGLSWFGKGLRGPARDALLTGALPSSLHASAFGTVRALDQTGGFLGPMAALVLAGSLSIPTLNLPPSPSHLRWPPLELRLWGRSPFPLPRTSREPSVRGRRPLPRLPPRMWGWLLPRFS